MLMEHALDLKAIMQKRSVFVSLGHALAHSMTQASMDVYPVFSAVCPPSLG